MKRKVINKNCKLPGRISWELSEVNIFGFPGDAMRLYVGEGDEVVSKGNGITVDHARGRFYINDCFMIHKDSVEEFILDKFSFLYLLKISFIRLFKLYDKYPAYKRPERTRRKQHLPM